MSSGAALITVARDGLVVGVQQDLRDALKSRHSQPIA